MRDPFEVLGRTTEAVPPPSQAFVADLMAAVEERLDTHATPGSAPPPIRRVAVIDPEVAPMHRQPSTDRRWLFAAAAVVLVVAAALLLVRRGDDPEQPAGGSTTVATTSPVADPMPLLLQQRWMSDHRDFVPADKAGVTLRFDQASWVMTQSNQGDTNPVHGDARPSGPDRFDVVSAASDVLDCDASTHGTYRWSTSPSGRILTVTAVSDPCVARVEALEGTYWRSACFDTYTNCLGSLDAGEYASQYINPLEPLTKSWEPIYGAVRYTVPDGWANTSDYPSLLGFAWADEYAGVTDAKPFANHEINLVSQAHLDAGNSCENSPLDRHPTATAFLDALEARPGVTLGERLPITVGGLQGFQVEVSSDRSAYVTCDGEQWMPLLVGGSDFGLAAAPDQAVRLIVLDGSPEAKNGLTAVLIQGTQDRWQEFLDEAMGIVASMRFS